MNLIDEGQGICQRISARGKPSANLWEGTLRFEREEEVKRRHSQARILCWRCPALEDCEARLVEHESKGHHIEGVVAGRYSTVKPHFNGTVQRRCAGCGEKLKILKTSKQGRPHAGEGFCEECYPDFRRKR